MVPMGTNTDEWIADVASYVRNSFGNAAPFVTAERVAAVRKANPRTSMWSFAELVSTTPMPLVNQAEWKATASHNPEAAANGINGQGATRWESGVAQEPGMWFQIELPQPVNVAEILVDALAGGRGGFGFGRGRGGALPSGPLASYSCRCRWTARHGASRSPKGQGQNPTTTIAVKPVQAKFVRVTQTGTPATAALGHPAGAHLHGRSSRVEAMTAMALKSINPATGETLATFDTLSPAAVEDRLRAPSAAFRAWKNTAFGGARAASGACRRHPRERVGALGRLMTLEMGKPLRAGIDEAAEVRARVPLLRRARRAFPRRRARRHRGERRATSATSRSASVLAIMPWNFPFWQVFRFAAPALMAGNVGLLKHASNVPQCALAIEDIFRRAGFPEGVFQTLLIRSADVAPHARRPARQRGDADRQRGRRRATWRRARARAQEDRARARRQRPVHRDAERRHRRRPRPRPCQGADDQQRAVLHRRQALHRRRGRGRSSSCERFVAAMSALRVGDPIDAATEVGPLATPRSGRPISKTQVQATVAAGARVLTGGARLPGPGNYFAPTVLVDIPPGLAGLPRGALRSCGRRLSRPSTSTRPSASPTIRPSASARASGPATTSSATASSRELETGQVFVNAMVVSDPRVPFGGVKRSGYGRELGVHGIREFVNVKTVWVAG